MNLPADGTPASGDGTTDPNANGAASDDGAGEGGGEPTEPTMSDLMARFDDFEKKTSGRIDLLTKDVTRNRHRIKASAGTPGEPGEPGEGKNKGTPASGEPTALTMEDLRASQKIGRFQSELPDELSAEIDEAVEELGYRPALSLAEKMLKAYKHDRPEGEPGKKAPPGKAASAAPRTSPTQPSTWKEYRNLIRRRDSGDKKAGLQLDELHADPNWMPPSKDQQS